MEQNNSLQVGNNGLSVIDDDAIKEFREKMQNFVHRLNKEPDPTEIDKTPDGKANSIPISFIEMTLDEYFFGLWDTNNFQYSVIANEVVGSIELTVLNPVTGTKIKRVGAAAIQIMVDKRPDGVSASEWANNPMNKKPNALDMGFPKLKAECVKNAAQSLGKLFGRDINRKKADQFNGLIKKEITPYEELKQIFEEKKNLLDEETYINGNRILDNKETASYNKLYKYLQAL